jgi:aspartyl protease family protein
MRRLLFLFLLLSYPLYGQKIQTKEVRINLNENWDDAQLKLEVCYILGDNIKVKFSEDLEYNWYNEYSGHMHSKGAAGGSLLHGKCSYFDGTGKLISQGYYNFGLQDSVWLSWNDYGEIETKSTYKNGVQIYYKGKFGDGRVWEAYSSIGKPDYLYRQYTDRNILEIETKSSSTSPYIHEGTEYYPNTKKIKKKYFTCSLTAYYGEYKEYSIDGKIICKGNYDKKYKLGHKIGLWLIYNESSSKTDTIRYKLSEKILNSDNEKEIGSLVYSPELKDWIKDGFWYKLDNTGSVTESKKMESISIKKISEIEQADINPDSPSISIKLIKTESGLLEVPVELNGVLKINFIFDSGASEVSLSPDVALTLIRTGTVSNTDFLPDQTYKFADGSIAKSKRFLIKELSIGAKKLYNIEASIANSIEAPMLIGQNVMNKLGSITIDYDSQLLIIKSK